MNGPAALWERYKKYYCEAGGLGLDVSRMHFPDGFFEKMQPSVERAFADMEALEGGAIANPDEGRRVGHYWLRAPELAPPKEAERIRRAWKRINAFVAKVHEGTVGPRQGGAFRNLLLIGIGGSALGPQFVADALGTGRDRMMPCFFDNTDPDGMDRVLDLIGHHCGLDKTLAVVISKSGGTPETRNGMLEAKAAYEKAGLDFAGHAVAITGRGSHLDETARREGWLARFPMWDWVGGRTSVTSAVGLVPMKLQGIRAEALLRGAAQMDKATRRRDARRNPAMLLALMWHHAGGGRGEKAMVVLPYKDRLALFSRYLQQLVMESLGKERDLTGRIVNQGIVVYGNKGSTDQHAYVQQLREGRNDFFTTFVEVLADRRGESVTVEEIKPGRGGRVAATSGDFLAGLRLGTRQALYENGRESITITMPKVDATNVGRLIALFERAVGFYASLININAYHQPGVEAGKRAATAVLRLQAKAERHLADHAGKRFSADALAAAVGAPDEAETLFQLLRHLAANGRVNHKGGRRPGGVYWVTR